MVDACRIRRKTGQKVRQGPKEVWEYYPDIYEGKCRFQQGTVLGFRTAHPTVGGRISTITVRKVHLPIDAPATEVDDEIIPTVSRDPYMVGRAFRVVGDFGKTYYTARQVEVEEISA